MARPLPLNPTFLPPTYGVLKSLLENPLKLPLHHEDGETGGGGTREERSLVVVFCLPFSFLAYSLLSRLAH